MNKGNALHFINRVDSHNCGDSMVTPLLYYYDFFKQYKIRRHDIRYIDFETISESDVVIIGGGGLFNYEEFTNRAINKVLGTGADVIAWSPGFNRHFEHISSIKTDINFEQFKSITVRDFQNDYGLDYLPDVTCKLTGLQKNYRTKRQFGIARHKNYPINDFDFDTITNDCPIDDILQFIGESEVVISNSFHMIYWALLMGKKTVCSDAFSSKFYSYKYKPSYYHTGSDSLIKLVEEAQTYDILDECIRENDTYFDKAKDIIENKLVKIKYESIYYDLVTENVMLKQKIGEAKLQNGDMIAAQLFIDSGNGFSENEKIIVTNNVYGDEVNSVYFNLSEISEIRSLRFDPIERQYCEIEIISAKTAEKEVEMVSQSAIKEGNKDFFLSTDPQYLIFDCCEKFLQIDFKLRVLSADEVEKSFSRYSLWIEDTCRQQEQIIEQTKKQLENTNKDLINKNNEIARKNESIENLQKTIIEKNLYIEQQRLLVDTLYNSTCWKITAPLRKMGDVIKHMMKGS